MRKIKKEKILPFRATEATKPRAKRHKIYTPIIYKDIGTGETEFGARGIAEVAKQGNAVDSRSTDVPNVSRVQSRALCALLRFPPSAPKRK